MERGKALVMARLKRRWSQRQAADKLGVSKQTLGRWEKGQSFPTPFNLEQIHQVYGLSPDTLGLLEMSPVPTLQQSPIEEHPLPFQLQDPTIRLMRLVWQHRPQTADYAILHRQMIQELESMPDSLTRRDALRRMAILPIEMSGLSLFSTTLKAPETEILAQCAAGVTACWYLRKGRELTLPVNVVSKYIPTLKIIAQASSTTAHRKAAADLLGQASILKSLLAKHVGESDEQAIGYAIRACQYAEASEHILLRISALRRLASAYNDAHQIGNAVTTAYKAKHLAETARDVSPAVKSYIYAGLANYLGQKQENQEALRMIGNAHSKFFADTPALPLWIDHNHANLLLQDGLTHYYLGLHQQAQNSFAQIATAEEGRGETARVEALLDQVLVEVQRADRQRDMEFCIDRFIQGIGGAIDIESQQRFSEAWAVYSAMCAAWPNHPRIHALREYIVHW